jgi:hypothetical protein
MRFFYSRFFTKRIMPKSGFKICWILAELFVLKLSENRLPAVNDNGESKTGYLHFLLYWNDLGEQYSTWIVHFLLHCPFKGRGSPSRFLKVTLCCQQWLPAINEAGSSYSTLHSKQYGEYQLSVFNDKLEFMQIMLTNGDSPPKWCSESRLSVVNNTGWINSPL